MAAATTRVVLGVILLGHGIGHALGIMAALGLGSAEGWSARSWLLTDALGDPIARGISFLVWALALLGFLGAALGLFGWLPHGWWRTLALVASVISLVGLALYWNAFPQLSSKLAAIGVDLAVLYALLIARWPSETILGT